MASTPTDPWAVVDTAPAAATPTADPWAVVKTEPAPPPPSVFQDLADDFKQGGIGALKTTGRTAVNLAKVASWLLGTSAATSPTLDYLKQQIGTPTGTAQTVGGLTADVATSLLPAGEIGKAADAAEAGAAAASKLPLVGKLARAVVQGGGAAATSAAQGQNPVAAGVLGGTVGALTSVAPEAAPAVRRWAVTSMIRALGPAGGRGPTDLAGAEEIAPGLVKEGFMPLTQDAARAQAAQMVKTTGGDIKTLLAGPSGDAAFDQPTLLRRIGAKRAALAVNPGNGQPPFVPAEQQATDKLYAALEQDVQQLGADPTARAVHALKSRWNDVVNWNAADPSAGSLTSVYKTGGDLIRAKMGTDAADLSQADQAFHKASTLNDILNAPNARRPGPGIAAALSPHARTAVGAVTGGTIGYREGGTTGAITGAVTGAALANLIQSPGFSYVSSALKSKLADALDRGDSARISQLVSTLTAQAAGYNRSSP